MERVFVPLYSHCVYRVRYWMKTYRNMDFIQFRTLTQLTNFMIQRLIILQILVIWIENWNFQKKCSPNWHDRDPLRVPWIESLYDYTYNIPKQCWLIKWKKNGYRLVPALSIYIQLNFVSQNRWTSLCFFFCFIVQLCDDDHVDEHSWTQCLNWWM